MAQFHSILCLSNIPLYICTYFLYPFLCWWTFLLLPFLGYCKQHCNEYWGACILSDHVFLWVYARKWDCRVIVVVVQSPSRVQLFATPWTAAFEASVSITISQSLSTFMFISSSDALFSCSQSFPASGTFPMSHLFVSDDQNPGASASASVLPVDILVWSPCCPGDFQESYPAPQVEGFNSLAFCLLVESYVSSIFSFSRNLHTVLQSSHTNLHSHQQLGGFPSLHILSNIYYLWNVWWNHSDLCEVILHCSFDLQTLKESIHIFQKKSTCVFDLKL